MTDSKPLVIVLSRNYSTGLGVIRSLGNAGYTVDLIACTKKRGSSAIASCSKYVRNSMEVVIPEIQNDSGAGLMKEIMRYTKKYEGKMVLFPVDDFTASVVDNHRQLLKDFFYMPEISGGMTGAINHFMNKTVQGEMARKAGLLIPDEWKISLKDEVLLPVDISYPCFVKPIQSVSGHKTEMKVCNHADALKKHLLEMQKNNREREVLIQQFLKIDKEYDLSGVCIDQNIVIPGIIEKGRIAKYETGVTMSGQMFSTDILKDVKEKVIKLLQSIHYMGMFDMELFQCGNKVYFNEINFRSGGPNYFYYQNGVNLPDIFVKEILGQGHTKEEEKITEFGKTFVYEKVAWEDYIHSYMTGKELRKCIKEADFTLLGDKEDPEPGKVFHKRIRLSSMKHKVYGLLRAKKPDKPNSKNVNTHKVVVTGRNYCNILTMVRALGEAGYDVDVLRVYKKKPAMANILGKMEPEASSKYVDGFYRCIVNNHPERMTTSLIKLGNQEQKILLMPVDDYTAYLIDKSYNQLKEYFIIPNVADKEGELSRLMDKNEQKLLAVKQGLPMPKSVLVKVENGEVNLPDGIHYPCFIKPNVSMNSTKARMMRCDDRQVLENVLFKYAKQEDFEVLIEEFIDIKEEYSILGIGTKDKAIAPAVFKVLKGGNKERKGVTVVGEAVSSEPFKEILDKCCRYVESIQYTGIFDIDLLESKEGKIYFIELNFRAGASTHLFTKTGVNLPGMFADDMLKNIEMEDVSASESVGKKFVSEKVLLEEYVRNDVSVFRAISYLMKADVRFIKDEKDRKPYKYFKKYCIVITGLKVIYWLRDNFFERGV